MCFICILVVLATLIACSPLRIYRQQPDVRSWEADIRKFEHLDSTEAYPVNAVLFAGSSSIRLWSALGEDLAPYPIIQREYGGAKLSDLAVYADRIIYPHSFAAIVLFVANDIAGNEMDKSPGEVDRLFNYLLKTIRRKYPEVPVFWIAITPTPLRWDVWPEIAEANKLIEGSCKKTENTYFIKTDSAFLSADTLPREELFQADRLHLNTQGYAVWTELIKGELDRVLISKTGH